MKNYKLIKQPLLFSILLATTSTLCAETSSSPDISINKGKYKDYYHIQLNLKNIPFSFSKDNNNKNYSTYTEKDLFSNGGQFEILIPKEHFPISAPSCSSNIIARMPWTNPSIANSKDLVNKKVSLFKELSNKKGDLNIALELNPYVTVLSKQPLKLELKNCNVFYRHNKGEYINYLGSIRK